MSDWVGSLRDWLGVAGTGFGIWSLILQILDRNLIQPKILQVFIRITDNLDYLIQVNLGNLGNKEAANCSARVYDEENQIEDLTFLPIDSPLGRIGPDWPSNSVFRLLPKSQINVRGYLNSALAGRRIHVRLFLNNEEVDRSDIFTLPTPLIQAPVPSSHIPTVTLTDEQVNSATRPPEPSYPLDEWEFLWFVYSGNSSNPWSSFINRTTKINLNFDEDWGEGEVDQTGQFDNVGFKASRTVTLTESGVYRFTIGGDDGIRLFISNNDFIEIFRIITGWKDQPFTIYAYDRSLTQGTYKILLEYYERTGAARAKFSLDKK